jgi:hypothetical protein
VVLADCGLDLLNGPVDVRGQGRHLPIGEFPDGGLYGLSEARWQPGWRRKCLVLVQVVFQDVADVKWLDPAVAMATSMAAL